MISHADQRPKQKHREENLPALPQEHFLLGKDFGLMLNHVISLTVGDEDELEEGVEQ